MTGQLLWKSCLRMVLIESSRFQAKNMTITPWVYIEKYVVVSLFSFFLSVLKQRQMLSWGWNTEKWNKQPLQINVSPSNKHSRQTDTPFRATENQSTIPSCDYFQICRNQITCHLILCYMYLLSQTCSPTDKTPIARIEKQCFLLLGLYSEQSEKYTIMTSSLHDGHNRFTTTCNYRIWGTVRHLISDTQ